MARVGGGKSEGAKWVEQTWTGSQVLRAALASAGACVDRPVHGLPAAGVVSRFGTASGRWSASSV